jgi:hypothetical protein
MAYGRGEYLGAGTISGTKEMSVLQRRLDTALQLMEELHRATLHLTTVLEPVLRPELPKAISPIGPPTATEIASDYATRVTTIIGGLKDTLALVAQSSPGLRCSMPKPKFPKTVAVRSEGSGKTATSLADPTTFSPLARTATSCHLHPEEIRRVKVTVELT